MILLFDGNDKNLITDVIGKLVSSPEVKTYLFIQTDSEQLKKNEDLHDVTIVDTNNGAESSDYLGKKYPDVPVFFFHINNLANTIDYNEFNKNIFDLTSHYVYIPILGLRESSEDIVTMILNYLFVKPLPLKGVILTNDTYH